MNKFLHILTLPFKWLFLIPIYIYKATISKIMPDVCIYQPTCSTYMILELRRYGLFLGLYLGFKRIHRCKPPYGGIDLPKYLRRKRKNIIHL